MDKTKKHNRNFQIYVIIVTWNGMKWINHCLDCLRKSTIDIKVIVIDNGSTDDTCKFIKENFPEVNLCEMSRNLGFGQANNEGIKIALKEGADYVYLLNQDAYIFPDMFECLLEVAEYSNEKNNIGVYSPLHLSKDIHKFDSQFTYYLKNITASLAEDLLLDKAQSSYLLDCVPAAGWLIPRRTLERVGGFDPIFFHYGEDHHYAQRVKYHGFRFCLVPAAKMIHDREGFGNSKLANHKKYFRTLKTEILLNITLSKSRAATLFLKAMISANILSVKALVHFRIKDAWEYQKAVMLNILSIPRYSKNRRQNKRIGLTWL